jgi:hypothetical protein
MLSRRKKANRHIDPIEVIVAKILIFATISEIKDLLA